MHLAPHRFPTDGDARAGLPRAGSPAGMRGNRNVKGNDDRHELLV
jgi:hypothetical protein